MSDKKLEPKRVRSKQISIRTTEKEYQRIKKKIDKSKLSQNEYFIRSALDKDIVIVEGLPEIIREVKRIGININQITKKVNQGDILYSEELKDVQSEVKDIWQLLNQLVQKQV